MSYEIVRNHIQRSISVKESILQEERLLNQILCVAEKIVECFAAGNKVILAGNGGSAADSQHIAAEFVSRFKFDRPGLPALSLTTDTSMLTAIGNDYGFDKVFGRQLQANGKHGDVFIGLSTSGKSMNVLNALSEASARGIFSVALTGEAGIGPQKLADLVMAVPSRDTAIIQESHIMIGHIICGLVEGEIFG